MKMQHTPGPWEAAIVTEKTRDGRTYYCRIFKYSGPIKREVARGFGVTAQEAEANADLIVKAADCQKPFLGWTTDKDILNQQREYWGAMNGIQAIKHEIERLNAALTKATA